MIFIKIGNYNVALKNIVYIRFTKGLFVIHFKDWSKLTLRFDNDYGFQKIQKLTEIFKSQNIEFIKIHDFYIVKNFIKGFEKFVKESGWCLLEIYFKNKVDICQTPWLEPVVIDGYIEKLR